jgi:parallel beta helix pectate lyase-like protein
MERRLTPAQAGSAAAVQREIDYVARTGGQVVLPEIELVLDRGLILRSGVELIGQGPGTVLRKGPGRVFPLSGYHNYGMRDVPLSSAAGLEAGMTVSVHDDRTHGGFYETFAVITWIDGDWVGLDHGIEADYSGGDNPCLTTAHPLIFGHHIHGAAIRDLALEGNRGGNETSMGGCRGGAVYFAHSREIEVSGVRERDYYGEGLSFQMCRDVTIRDSVFDGNTGNGLHPGAGSTNVLFEGCKGRDNERSGFFFCVRANHITVRDSSFERNAVGISVGTRDSHNIIEACAIEANHGPGIRVRETPSPTQPHSCLIRDCALRGNARGDGSGHVEIVCDAYDWVLEHNTIRGDHAKPGVHVAPGARRIYLQDNTISACAAAVAAAADSLVADRPVIACGFGDWSEDCFRHLSTA